MEETKSKASTMMLTWFMPKGVTPPTIVPSQWKPMGPRAIARGCCTPGNNISSSSSACCVL